MLRYRPAALVCLALTAGVAAGLFFNIWLSIITASLVWSATMIVRPARRWRIIMVTAIVVFVIGSLYSKVFGMFDSVQIDTEKVYCFDAAVADVMKTERGTRATIEILENNYGFEDKRAYIYTDTPLKAGDAVYVETVLSESSVSAKANGVDYYAYGEAVAKNNVVVSGFKYELWDFRKKLSAVIDECYDTEAANFYTAMITGDRSKIDDRLNGSFARSGLSHILAISGQHFSILIYSVFSFLVITIRRRKLSCCICIALAVLYTLFVGATPPVLRACIMCCAVFAANLATTYVDSITALCAALAGIVVFSPYATASVGLQLSFLATLGILTLSELTKRKSKGIMRFKLVRLITAPLAITFAATIFCLPVLLCSFDFVSIVSPLANLAVNVFVGPSLATSIIALPIIKLLPNGGDIAIVPEKIFYCIKWISDYAASFSFATFASSLPYVKLISFPAFIAILTGLVAKRKHIFKIASVCLASIVVIIMLCTVGHTRSILSNNLIYMYSNNKNDFTLINDGKNSVLIDGYGTTNCSGMLLDRSITHLDTYIITKANADALERLKKTICYISIDDVYIHKSYAGGSYEKSIAQTGCNVLYFDDSLCFDNATISINENGYALNTENKSITVTLLNGCKADSAHDCNGLIVTKNCIAKELPRQLLPKNYNKLYIFKSNGSHFTEFVKSNANSIIEFYNSVELRFGDDGLWEVKQ